MVDGIRPLRGLAFASRSDGSTLISNFSVGHHLVSLPVLVDDELRRARSRVQRGLRGPVVVKLGAPSTLNPTDPGLIHSGECPGSYAPNLFRAYAPGFPRPG